MRLVLLLPVLFSVAAPAYAEGARESRYGPTAPRQASAAAPRYEGPMLGWANKRQAPTAPVPAATPAAPAQPAPLAAWAGYQAPPAPRAPAATPAAPPTSLYSPPRAQPIAAAAPEPIKDWSNYRSPRVTAVAAAPQHVAAAGDTTSARFYSVGRDYGLTPDAAPRAASDNRVLVIAPEPPEAKDAIPMHGSADWLAAGARGDDDDDSATRRAKARNEDL